MVPDHTLLLKEGEVFLAIDYDMKAVKNEVIALRVRIGLVLFRNYQCAGNESKPKILF
jgi:hypothetical protein